MTILPRRFLSVNAGVAAALASLLATSCAPQYAAPQQVQASNPSVTYKYRTDQDLLQVNQTAAAFCNQYRAMPRASSFTATPDGGKVVVFECVQPTMVVAPTPPFSATPSYTYRTDQELLDASRNAQTYCMNSGAPKVVSNITTNPDGTRTVAFQCSRM